MPMMEAESMPPNTGVPTSRRAKREGPTATTSGSKPRMNAKDVIITGRNRNRAAATDMANAMRSSAISVFGDVAAFEEALSTEGRVTLVVT